MSVTMIDSSMVLPTNIVASGYVPCLPNDFQEERDSAGAFISVYSTNDVSMAIQKARALNMRPAICRYQMSKTESLSNQVVIDIRPLAQISVNRIANTVTIQPTAAIIDVDQVLANYGRCVVAGTFNVLRLGGVALGGGYGWLSGRHGVVADSLVAATVVLAGGRIVETSEEVEPDLFWGIRGSYSNLGITTSLTFHTHPMPRDIYMCTLTFPCPDTSTSAFHDVLTAAETIRSQFITADSPFCIRFTVPESTTDTDSELQPQRPTLTAMLYLFDCPSQTAFDAIFQPLLSLGIDNQMPQKHVETVPYLDLNGMLNDTLDHTNQVFASTGANIPVSRYSATHLATVGANLQRSVATCHSHNNKFSIVMGIDYRDATEVVGGTGDAERQEKIGRMAFAARHDGPILYFRARWDSTTPPEVDKEYREFVKGLGRELRTEYGLFEEHGMPGAYPGFCSQGDLSAKELFGPNYQKMLAVKRKYDPTDVFNPGFLL